MENKLEIQPLFNFVVVEKDEEKGVSDRGIIIPDNAKEKPSTGVVIACGNGLYNEETGKTMPMTVKVGDKVLFGKFAGQVIKLNGEEKTILRETDILGILH